MSLNENSIPDISQENYGTAFASKVAIIGRPNVGKSTLFNILTNSRKSVVKDQAGVTRDIIIEPVDIWGKKFDLIDTGGVTESQDMFSKLIREQVKEFLFSVDFIVAVMDGRIGLVPEDRDIIKIAKQTGKPILLVINKVDKQHEEEIAKADFYEFGLDVVSASFEQRFGVSEIMEWIHARIPEQVAHTKEGIKVEMYPADAALVNILKMHGSFEKDNAQQSVVIKVTRK